MEKKTIHSLMDERRKFTPKDYVFKHSELKSPKDYDRIYEKSVKDPEGFWAKQAEQLHWFSKWDEVYSFDEKIRLTRKQQGATGLKAARLTFRTTVWTDTLQPGGKTRQR